VLTCDVNGIGAKKMNFTESIGAGLSQYAEFDGRASRAEYWYWTLFTAVAVGTLFAFDVLLGAGFILTFVGSLALALPSIAIFVRRMHDTDRSGLWYFVSFIPFGQLLLFVFLLQKGTTGRNRYGI
jgi:uncharacterized membrane protein YhaH (DUF805 family)